MVETSPLRRLRDQPFALLLEMERRAQGARGGTEHDESAREWVGIAFRVDRTVLLTPRDDVREVMRVPPVTRVPGARAWVRGLANVRGQLLPLTDLRMWLKGSAPSTGRSARVLAVNHRRVPAGLIVDEVYGFRRFRESELAAAPATAPFAGIEDLVMGAFARDGETWPVLSLTRLVENQRFRNAAE
jgi:twitching motility protein PilI